MTALMTTTPGNDWEALLPTIRHMFANGATDPEFKIFCETARLLGLNPVLRQVWCVKNLNRPDLPAQIYASRDGLLAVAHRSGQFDGMESGVRKDDSGNVVGAYCRIWRKDMSHPFEVEIIRSEYDTKKSLWESKPATMCVKVAEAHCLRRAFDICGVYTPDEMPEPEPAVHEVPDTSMPAPKPAPVKVEPKVLRVAVEPSEPVARCEVCGRGTDEFPAIRITQNDGKSICGSCLRKAEKEAAGKDLHVPSSVAPAPAKVPAPKVIGEGFVCASCGKAVTNSEKNASMLMMSKVLCKGCMQAWTADNKVGA